VCLPCGHREWHHHCIYSWLERQSSCPLCRASASPCQEGFEGALHALAGHSPAAHDCERVLRLLSLPEAQLLADHEILEAELSLLETELEELQEAQHAMELELEELSCEPVDKSPDVEAQELLDRFAAAALRTNLRASELFLALSPEGAPLALEAAQPVLSAFGGVSELGVDLACQRLDVNQSGWIEEEDLEE
ncbi:unnamed protein product, partial [Symbiodinium pilosum]